MKRDVIEVFGPTTSLISGVVAFSIWWEGGPGRLRLSSSSFDGSSILQVYVRIEGIASRMELAPGLGYINGDVTGDFSQPACWIDFSLNSGAAPGVNLQDGLQLIYLR